MAPSSSRSAAPVGGSGRLLGAYGLRLKGVDAAAALLVRADRDWPTFELDARLGSAAGRRETVTESRAELRLRNGGEIVIERAEGRITFRTPLELRPDEIVHPYLAPAAAVIGHWLGRESLHAGAFTVDGGVWALLGEREAGKSSTLAHLSVQGHGVVCDDMLVLDRTTPLAGPRSLDLRRETAEHLGVGEPLGVVGARERWRITLEPVPERLPLRGCIFLDWGDRVEAARVSPSERLPRLFRHRGVRLPPGDPAALLELASLPAWELLRPRGLASIEATAVRLLALARGDG